MNIKGELEQHIGQASQVESLNLLPPNAPYFQQRLAELVTDILDGEMGPSLSFQSACKETVERLLPLVDFLTQPRSITEFQELKRNLLETIWNYDRDVRFARREPVRVEEKQICGVVGWLYLLLPAVRIFPLVTLDNLVLAKMSPDKIWQEFEIPPSYSPRPVNEKIISISQAIELARRNQEENQGRNGLIMGKWRLCHWGHIGLFEAAKHSLGRDGILFVGVESQRSIWQRRGQAHAVLPNEHRLIQIAAMAAVDYAILLNPNDEELQDLDEFYCQTWQDLNPDIVFFGSQDYHWRTTYKSRARRLGTLLLWKYPTAPLSSSKLLELIKNTS